MPRSSGAEIPQRKSLRGPSHLRTSGSDSDPLHHRAKTDRSPKLGGLDRKSPRGTQSDPPVTQKKLGTRIADLESQLGQAQDELKSLKEQLVSAEAAKKAAQDQLDRKAKKPIKEPAEVQEKHLSQKPKSQELKRDDSSCNGCEISEENQQETDVFEVPVEKVAIEATEEFNYPTNEGELKIKSENIPIESSASLEPEKLPSFDEIAQKNDEISSLKSKLEEKEKELGAFCQENEGLKMQLQEKSSEISAAQSKEVEITMRLNEAVKELEESKNTAFEINKKLEASESAKADLEAEMKKLRVQTEQWRKAADAAAAVLSGEVQMNERRVSERCGSMDKHIGGMFDTPGGGYGNGYFGSPGLTDDSDDIFGGGKKKGSSGIRMFGELWKKKGHK